MIMAFKPDILFNAAIFDSACCRFNSGPTKTRLMVLSADAPSLR